MKLGQLLMPLQFSIYEKNMMTFHEFIKQYDFEGSIVLLEGKRNVPGPRQRKTY